MNEETLLRAILTLDEKNGRHVPAGHNLTVQKAKERVMQLRTKGTQAVLAVQLCRHTGHVKNCPPCCVAAENLSETSVAATNGNGSFH